MYRMLYSVFLKVTHGAYLCRLSGGMRKLVGGAASETGHRGAKAQRSFSLLIPWYCLQI